MATSHDLSLHKLRYVVAAEGVKYRLWSLGPDGIDQDGSGDDVPLP